MDWQIQARRDERGATAAEYAVLVAGVAVALVAATFALGEDLTARWGELSLFIRGL